jgi:hypothetical protein
MIYSNTGPSPLLQSLTFPLSPPLPFNRPANTGPSPIQSFVNITKRVAPHLGKWII